MQIRFNGEKGKDVVSKCERVVLHIYKLVFVTASFITANFLTASFIMASFITASFVTASFYNG